MSLIYCANYSQNSVIVFSAVVLIKIANMLKKEIGSLGVPVTQCGWSEDFKVQHNL